MTDGFGSNTGRSSVQDFRLLWVPRQKILIKNSISPNGRTGGSGCRIGASRATICLRSAGQSLGPCYAGPINRDSSYYESFTRDKKSRQENRRILNSACGLKSLGRWIRRIVWLEWYKEQSCTMSKLSPHCELLIFRSALGNQLSIPAWCDVNKHENLPLGFFRISCCSTDLKLNVSSGIKLVYFTFMRIFSRCCPSFFFQLRI